MSIKDINIKTLQEKLDAKDTELVSLKENMT